MLIKVFQLVLLKDEKVKLEPKGKGARSGAWNSFAVVYYLGIPTKMAACLACSTVKEFKTSTKYLLRHITKCKGGAPAVAKIATPLTAAEQLHFKKLAFIVCAKELRPFRTFDGLSMKALGQALIDVGVQHGPLSINSVSLNYIYVFYSVFDWQYYM